MVLVGTAHVSRRSVEDVRRAIEEYDPDIVCVELDERRREVLEDRKGFEERPITEMIRGNKAAFFIAHILLSSYQRRLGEEFGAEPGAEMLAAIEAAREREIEVVLADREIGVTLRRAWTRMGLREKLRLLWEFLKAMTGAEELEEEIDLEELMDEDVLTMMMEELSAIAPSIGEVLIEERDAYLAKRIQEASERGTVVAVVGAGHVRGIRERLRDPAALEATDLADLEAVPETGVSWLKVIGVGIVAVVLAIFGFLIYRGFITGDYTQLVDAFIFWVLINGSLSALGAAIARGHPFSIGTAFVAAPITSLNPTLAAGWFAGLVELKMRTPLVRDFEAMATVETFRDWVDNRVTRVLLVTAFANLGSVVGTWIGAAYLVDLLSRSLGV